MTIGNISLRKIYSNRTNFNDNNLLTKINCNQNNNRDD